MRFVSIEDARPGMCLAYDLYDSMGRTMVGSGCELTASYINKLNEYGFSGVYIEDEQSKDIYIEATIPEKLRQEGFKCVQENDIDRCAEIAQQIVENLLSRKNVCLDMTDLRSYDDYTYAHSVNVAVLCCVIGMGMGMSERDLNYLVTAALLHDLGKLATVYKGNIIKNLIMDCQSYTKYRPNETTGGIFVSWRRKEELPTGA